MCTVAGGMWFSVLVINVLTNQPDYAVTSFDGEKRFIISNTSWLGGKNPFLGIAYLVVGSLCGLMSGVFFYIHLKVKSK